MRCTIHFVLKAMIILKKFFDLNFMLLINY
jgi:hypothetical protein